MRTRILVYLLLLVIAVGGVFMFEWQSQSQRTRASPKHVNMTSRERTARYAKDFGKNEFDTLVTEVAYHTATKDFATLEEMAQEFRSNDSRFTDGRPKLYAFYDGTDDGLAKMEAHESAEAADGILSDWLHARPDSITQIVAEASYRIDQGWKARGGGWAFTVRKGDMNTFEEKLGQARTALAELSKVKGKYDPHAIMLQIGLINTLGGNLDEARRLTEDVVAHYPTYDPVYAQMAITLTPRWRGKLGDTEKFADDLAKELPAPRNDIAYARIAWSIRSLEGDKFFVDTRFKYDRIKRAYETLLRQYPDVDNKKKFCVFATLAEDRDVAARLFTEIGDKWSDEEKEKDWGSETQLKTAHQWALGNGSDPNAKSPLITAIESGSVDQVESVIKNGANVNARDTFGFPPLMDALGDKRHDIVMALVNAGANILGSADNGTSVAASIVGADEVELVEMMLQKGHPLNAAAGDNQWTLLHLAAYSNAPKVASLLLSMKGIQVDSRDGFGETPLMIAAKYNAVKVMPLLLKGGADPNARDGRKNCALGYAANDGSEETMRILLKAGADPNAKNDTGKTPLDFAQFHHKEGAAAILRTATYGK